MRQRLTELTGVGARSSTPETHVPAQRARQLVAARIERGVVEDVGADVSTLSVGDFVIAPFALELEGLRRLEPRMVAIVYSVDPAIAGASSAQIGGIDLDAGMVSVTQAIDRKLDRATAWPLIVTVPVFTHAPPRTASRSTKIRCTEMQVCPA